MTGKVVRFPKKQAFLQWNSICCHFHHNPSLPQSSSANCAKVVERSFPRRRNVSSSTLKPMCHHLCHHQHQRSHHLGVSNHFLRVIITLPLLPHLTSQAFSPKIMLSVHFKLPACHFGERLTNNGWQLSGKHYGEETFFRIWAKVGARFCSVSIFLLAMVSLLQLWAIFSIPDNKVHLFFFHSLVSLIILTRCNFELCSGKTSSGSEKWVKPAQLSGSWRGGRMVTHPLVATTHVYFEFFFDNFS